MATITEIKEDILKPYMDHRQLSIREAETLTLNLIELLTTKEVKDSSTMKYLARFLTKQDYSDLVEERNIVKLCGYPLCCKSQGRIRDPFINQSMTTFLRQNNPYAYLSEYCTKAHFRCSQFYQFQLSDEALFARTGAHLEDYEPTTETQLLEEMIARESDVRQMIRGMNELKLSEDDKEEMERDISDMLSEIKIVEIAEPNIIGDLGREV